MSLDNRAALCESQAALRDLKVAATRLYNSFDALLDEPLRMSREDIACIVRGIVQNYINAGLFPPAYRTKIAAEISKALTS